jgi:hypothetical protein
MPSVPSLVQLPLFAHHTPIANVTDDHHYDHAGEPTVKSANATGEWVVFGLLVLDIVGFVYLFHHSGAKPGSTSTDTDKSIV